MTSFDKCPTCGAEVTVVGKTTQHYEPVYNSESWNLLVKAKLAADDEVKKLRESLSKASNALREYSYLISSATVYPHEMRELAKELDAVK